MAVSGIVLREHPYKLKDDRASQDPTIYYIMPKTVKSANETARNFAEATKLDRKTGQQVINPDRMNAVEAEEWVKAVRRVENFLMPNGAPEDGYDFCLALLNSGELKGKQETIDQGDVQVDYIRIETTTDKNVLKRIFWAMSPDHAEEIMHAYYNYSSLTEAEKNG